VGGHAGKLLKGGSAVGRIIALIGVIFAAVAILAGTTLAARSTATLDVSFPTASAASTGSTSVPYGTPYVVSGCGYAKGVGVTVVVQSPEAISFAGQVANADGCISLSNFFTQGPGHYQLDAWQQLRHRSSRVASTSFDLS
jgi:hypothetical protein